MLLYVPLYVCFMSGCLLTKEGISSPGTGVADYNMGKESRSSTRAANALTTELSFGLPGALYPCVYILGFGALQVYALPCLKKLHVEICTPLYNLITVVSLYELFYLGIYVAIKPVALNLILGISMVGEK